MEKQFDKRQIKNLAIYFISIGIVVVMFMFLLSVSIIGYSVKAKCQMAQVKYNGNCIEALIKYLEDENNDIRNRNSAIWALGELGDSRALPVLEKYYVGYYGGRCNLNEEISQYELKKAINLAGGGFNATAFFWRFGQGID